MGKAIHTATTSEIPVPDKTPEMIPELPAKPDYEPEIKPDGIPSPAAPQSPGEPDSPGREPEVPQILPEKDTIRHPAQSISPDNDPDLPEKPGPPLADPESPRG